MGGREPPDSAVISLAYLPATPRQRLIVLGVVLLQLAAWGAIAPFSGTPLIRLDAFVPSIELVIAVNDFITSILLFAQFAILPSRAILALAGGYLFTALIVVIHVLAFPGAFSATGLLGAGLQTAPWLAFFWHIGSTIAVLAYACLKDTKNENRATGGSAASPIGWCVALVIASVCGLAWIAIAAEHILPAIFINTVEGIGSIFKILGVVDLSIATTTAAVLWVRRRCVLDYWLLITISALIFQQTLGLLLNTERFSLGFYGGRLFLLFGSVVVLALLLEETTRLYAQLARSKAVLERERSNRLMSIDAITASIAHEVNQPLAAIVTNSEAARAFLERTTPDVTEANAALGDIIDDAHRISAALDSIRTLFRRFDRESNPIDLNVIALEVLKAVRGELSKHGVTVRSSLATGMPLVRGNSNQLHQVLFNLVQNALEAMIETTDRSRVLQIRTEPDGGGAVALSVVDSGPGIQPERLNDIFEAFITTKPQGMGLGLAICRTLVESHGGQLTVSSDGKNGATFRMVLPRDSDGNVA